MFLMMLLSPEKLATPTKIDVSLKIVLKHQVTMKNDLPNWTLHAVTIRGFHLPMSCHDGIGSLMSPYGVPDPQNFKFNILTCFPWIPNDLCLM